MILKLFSIYDSKARAHLPMFTMPQEGMALRTFSECLNSPDHQFGKNPADYTLFCHGDFDDNSAEFKLQTMKPLANGVELIQTHPLEEQHGAKSLSKIGNGAPILPST